MNSTTLRALCCTLPTLWLTACSDPVVSPFAASQYAPKKVEPAAKPATKKEPKKAQEKKTYKKPVRMNGRGEVTSISLEDFFQRQQSGRALIFDARPGFLYAMGHIPGAINLPKKNCDEAIAKTHEATIKQALAEGKIIVVYCSSITCPDARAVATHIAGFGHPSVVFSGGWSAWQQAGMPTE